MKNMLWKPLLFIHNRADDTKVAERDAWGGGGIGCPPPPPPPLFCLAKIEKGSKEKKRKSFKAETIKRFSPRSKCYCFSNGYYFIQEHLEFKYFSVFHSPYTFKSTSPALPNLELIYAAFHRKFISLRCVLGGIFSYVLFHVVT